MMQFSVQAPSVAVFGATRPCWRHLPVRAQQRPQHLQDSGSEPMAPGPRSASAAKQPPSEQPWQLMGRVVRQDRVVLSDQGRHQLMMGAAARAAHMEPQAFADALQELVTLLPGLQPRLMGLQPTLLGRLAGDTHTIANKLVQLRVWFPSADLTQLLDRRPSLLLDEEWAAVAGARSELLAMFGSQGSVDDLVTRQPLLLCDDVAGLVGELERLMPGVDVEIMLRRNPGVVYSVQRGTSRLGPGAEFM